MTYNRNVDLDSLVAPNLTVTLNGKTVKVKTINGRSYQLLVKMQGGDIAALFDLAGRCLPDLTTDEVMELTASQAGAVVELASSSVEDVEAMAPPNSAPAGQRGTTQLSS